MKTRACKCTVVAVSAHLNDGRARGLGGVAKALSLNGRCVQTRELDCPRREQSSSQQVMLEGQVGLKAGRVEGRGLGGSLLSPG